MADTTAKKMKLGKDFRIEKYIEIRISLTEYKNEILDAVSLLGNSKSHFACFCFVRIDPYCNGSCSCSFNQAWCPTTRSIDRNEKQVVASFRSLYDIKCLEVLLSTPEKDLYIEMFSVGEWMALQRLADFLQTVEGTNELLRGVYKETLKAHEWASILGTHVLSKLAVDGPVLVSDLGYVYSNPTCSCGCNTPIYTGDTSMGHTDVWHGCVDILLGPVAFQFTDCEDEDSYLGEQQSLEMKLGNLEHSRHQFLAQTIVSSFVQRSGLVPFIVVTKKVVKIFMYCPVTDLLYESSECPLFDDGLVFGTVIALWAIINHFYFHRTIPMSHMEFGYCANFKESLVHPSKLKIFKSELKLRGCKPGQTIKRNFLPGEWNGCMIKYLDDN